MTTPRGAWQKGLDGQPELIAVADPCPYCGHDSGQESDSHDRSQTAVLHRVLAILEDECTGHLPKHSCHILMRRVLYGEALETIGQLLGCSKQHVQQTIVKLCDRWPTIATVIEDTRSAHRGTYTRHTTGDGP